MENLKYLGFYALLIIVIVLGALHWHWLTIMPAALILTIAVIFVKGQDWRKVMGNSDMNGALVFVATYVSQVLIAAILFGLGRLLAMIF